MRTIYIEEAIIDHPRVKSILNRYPRASLIPCQHYGEVFNTKSQNFRIQKKQPALILAEKTGKRVLPTPEGFGIGGSQNYYFSHMLNCLYDCRYCFLQGMYPSANYVLFINYDDFFNDIKAIADQQSEPCYFFSGYNCDSLAFEPLTQFVDTALPYFADLPNAILELRTKSTAIQSLLATPPIKNCIIAFSFTPDKISRAVEHRVPSVAKRIKAMHALAQQGYLLGLRFDPLIYTEDFTELYGELITAIFATIPTKSIHSVSVGPMRFPINMYQKIIKLYPHDKLLNVALERRSDHMSYQQEIELNMKQTVINLVKNYISDSLIFECNNL